MYRREYENRSFEMEMAGSDRVSAKSAAKTRIAVFALAAAMMFGSVGCSLGGKHGQQEGDNVQTSSSAGVTTNGASAKNSKNSKDSKNNKSTAKNNKNDKNNKNKKNSNKNSNKNSKNTNNKNNNKAKNNSNSGNKNNKNNKNNNNTNSGNTTHNNGGNTTNNNGGNKRVTNNYYTDNYYTQNYKINYDNRIEKCDRNLRSNPDDVYLMYEIARLYNDRANQNITYNDNSNNIYLDLSKSEEYYIKVIDIIQNNQNEYNDIDINAVQEEYNAVVNTKTDYEVTENTQNNTEITNTEIDTEVTNTEIDTEVNTQISDETNTEISDETNTEINNEINNNEVNTGIDNSETNTQEIAEGEDAADTAMQAEAGVNSDAQDSEIESTDPVDVDAESEANDGDSGQFEVYEGEDDDEECYIEDAEYEDAEYEDEEDDYGQFGDYTDEDDQDYDQDYDQSYDQDYDQGYEEENYDYEENWDNEFDGADTNSGAGLVDITTNDMRNDLTDGYWLAGTHQAQVFRFDSNGTIYYAGTAGIENGEWVFYLEDEVQDGYYDVDGSTVTMYGDSGPSSTFKYVYMDSGYDALETDDARSQWSSAVQDMSSFDDKMLYETGFVADDNYSPDVSCYVHVGSIESSSNEETYDDGGYADDEYANDEYANDEYANDGYTNGGYSDDFNEEYIDDADQQMEYEESDYSDWAEEDSSDYDFNVDEYQPDEYVDVDYTYAY